MSRTILVTGASSGIGAATVALFAQRGWNVIAGLRRPEVCAPADNVLVLPLDVQQRDSIEAAVAAGIERFGAIDALLNNAGFSLFGVFEGISAHKVREQFDVNVFGLMEVTRALLPHFRKRQQGLILNVSSRAGLVGLPLISLYCASKFALEGFSESLAYELAGQNITVKLIVPIGGIAGTHFGERVNDEQVHNAALADYQDFVTRTGARYAAMRGARMATSADVAQVIFDAAMDGSHRLRYFVGEDTGEFLKAKRERPEQAYIDFMRARFL